MLTRIERFLQKFRQTTPPKIIIIRTIPIDDFNFLINNICKYVEDIYVVTQISFADKILINPRIKRIYNIPDHHFNEDSITDYLHSELTNKKSYLCIIPLNELSEKKYKTIIEFFGKKYFSHIITTYDGYIFNEYSNKKLLQIFPKLNFFFYDIVITVFTIYNYFLYLIASIVNKLR